MSRLAKKPIIIPDKVEVKLTGQTISVKGPLGELSYTMLPGISAVITDKQIMINRIDDLPKSRAFQGLAYRLIINLIVGVTTGFKKELELIGVGYKVAAKGKDLEMFLGFSHPVVVKAPEGIQFKVEKNNISISGIDKQLVGETAAKMRALKAPEPYKGKGLKYVDEQVRRKAGKMAGSSA